jgi:hypothetical protein
MQKARLAAPITDAQIRLAHFCASWRDLHNLQQLTICFCRKTACTGCTDITAAYEHYQGC